MHPCMTFICAFVHYVHFNDYFYINYFCPCTLDLNCQYAMLGYNSVAFSLNNNRFFYTQVDYECILETNTWKTLNSAKHHMNNLSLLLQWSPYSTEKELLKQVSWNYCIVLLSMFIFLLKIHPLDIFVIILGINSVFHL